MRIRFDKIASATVNASIRQDAVIGRHIPARAGVVLAVRVLDAKSTYNTLEDPSGRMTRVQQGDVLAAVLGCRDALRGYQGEVPEEVRPGDILHLLNLGGVVGRCTSASPDVGPPARVEVLGVVMRCDGADRGPVRPLDVLPPGLPPVVFVVGSCMSAGKTAAACALIRSATRAGLRVSACKLTGVALRRDALEMADHGAVFTVTFNDAGLASTAGADNVVQVARGCLTAAGSCAPDLIVAELGDGLLGAYGVREILADPGIRAAAGGLVLAANDPVAAWGAGLLLREMGWSATVVTGPATDNEAGCRAVREHVGAPAANAHGDPEGMANTVLSALRQPAVSLRGCA
jgi:hypothetical protein